MNSNTKTYVDISGSPKIVQKKRIHKKKPVVVDETATAESLENTTFVSETDIDNLTSGMSVLTMEEQKPDKKAKKNKQVKAPVDNEDDESSVHTTVLEKKPKKMAVSKKQPTEQVAEIPITTDTPPVEPVKKARAPRKPKVVVPIDPDATPVEPVKKARAPRKPKAVVLPVATGDTDEPVKKAKAKANKAEKQPVEKQVVLHGPENPNTVEQFFNILKPFIKQSSRYTALAEKPNGTVYPVFLKITGNFNEETRAYPCEFFKDIVAESEETGDVESKPIWTSVLEKGVLTMDQCFNIIPFDKNFKYVYLRPLQIPVEEE